MKARSSGPSAIPWGLQDRSTVGVFVLPRSGRSQYLAHKSQCLGSGVVCGTCVKGDTAMPRERGCLQISPALVKGKLCPSLWRIVFSAGTELADQWSEGFPPCPALLSLGVGGHGVGAHAVKHRASRDQISRVPLS